MKLHLKRSATLAFLSPIFLCAALNAQGASLEVDALPTGFRDWRSDAVTLNARRPLDCRWHGGLSATHARWHLSVRTQVSVGIYRVWRDVEIASGNAGRAYRFSKTYFSLPLQQHLPAQPDGRTYKVSLSTYASLSRLGTSNKVTIHYRQATSGGTGFTTKGTHPELWTPMPVRVTVNPLSMVVTDEGDDEEPYLMVYVAFVDGTNVDMSNPGASFVHVRSPMQTHGIVPLYNGGLKPGQRSWMSAANSRFDHDMLPLGLDELDLLERTNRPLAFSHQKLLDNSFVMIHVRALEEDDSPTVLADLHRAGHLTTLRDRLETHARGLSMSALRNSSGKADPAGIYYLPFENWDPLSLRDSDDQIDFATIVISYREILEQRNNVRDLDLRKTRWNRDTKRTETCVHYRLRVQAQRR